MSGQLLLMGGSLIMQGVGAASSNKASKKYAAAQKEAGYFNASILEGNADEILRTAKINASIADYNYNAVKNAGLYNEELKRKEAERVQEVGLDQAEQVRKIGERNASTSIAAYSASNVAITGSSYDVIMDQWITNEQDALTVIYNAMMEASALQAEAENIRMKSEIDQFNLQSQRTELLRKGEFESKNMKQQAELERMRGEAGASSTLKQAQAQTISTIGNIAAQAASYWK